jgi:hypothetical protein
VALERGDGGFLAQRDHARCGEHVDGARAHRPSGVGIGDDEGRVTSKAWFDLHDWSPYDGCRPGRGTGTLSP